MSDLETVISAINQARKNGDTPECVQLTEQRWESVRNEIIAGVTPEKPLELVSPLDVPGMPKWPRLPEWAVGTLLGVPIRIVDDPALATVVCKQRAN